MDQSKKFSRRWLRVAAIAGLGIGAAAMVLGAEEGLGKWKTHDMTRPRPPVITPGTASTPEQPGTPPSDAVVLFDGKNVDQWQGHSGKPAAWKVQDGYMEAAHESIETKEPFGDVQLHLEWSEPPAQGSSQGRGNSGVIFANLYEIQILDSYKNDTYPDGQCAAVYGQNPPLVNVSRPPGEWQTYDIIFHAPQFDGKELKKPATVTVLQNGVLVQDHWVIKGYTGAAVPTYTAHPSKMPLQIQFHGNPLRFRNVWIRPLEKLEDENGGTRDEAGTPPDAAAKPQ